MNEKLKTISFFVCCFFVYCVIGWGYEVIWEAIIGNGFVNKGFLYGGYLPIYGFGTLILYFMLRNLQAKKIKVFNINITPILVFVSIFFIASSIEYAVSWIMEILFNQRWWDYSSDILNINGRVSVRNSLLLTTGAMAFLYGVQPLLNKLLIKIKSNILNILAFIIIVVMSGDLILTILKYIQ